MGDFLLHARDPVWKILSGIVIGIDVPGNI
jgi:hypothetical protein